MRRTDSLEKTWCWERLRAEEKGVTEDEMVGWHHRLSEHESEQTPWDSGGQESLLCCSPWDHKELDMTEQLNNNVPWEKAHIQLPCHVEDTTTLSILLGCQSTSPGLRAYTAQEMSCTKVYLQCPGGDTSNSTIFFFLKPNINWAIYPCRKLTTEEKNLAYFQGSYARARLPPTLPICADIKETKTKVSKGLRGKEASLQKKPGPPLSKG